MNKTEELKPCPFCDGEAKYESTLNIIPLIDENGAYVDYDRMDYWERVYCTECGAEIVSISDDEEEGITIKKWNRRTGKPERLGKWWIERDKERCVNSYHCGNCDIYGSYIGHSSISKYCPRCGIKMDTSKAYEYEEATKEARQNDD